MLDKNSPLLHFTLQVDIKSPAEVIFYILSQELPDHNYTFLTTKDYYSANWNRIKLDIFYINIHGLHYVVEAPFGTGHQNIGQGLSQLDISIFYSENP